jgi:hypothetical protein
MSRRFVEGNLLFEFGERWTTLFRWDRHPDYLGGMGKTHGGKGVDFVGILDERVPYLIEVKDFRYHMRDPEKISPQHEFELKIRATVAALVGVRWQEPPRECVVAFEALRASRRPRLVLWQEDARPGHGGGPQAARLGGSSAAVLTDQIKKNMTWLDADTIVTSSADDEYHKAVPGSRCQALPEVKRLADDSTRRYSRWQEHLRDVSRAVAPVAPPPFRT